MEWKMKVGKQIRCLDEIRYRFRFGSGNMSVSIKKCKLVTCEGMTLIHRTTSTGSLPLCLAASKACGITELSSCSNRSVTKAQGGIGGCVAVR